MYNNVGMLIGHYRKKLLSETKLAKYNQSEFVKSSDQIICTQPKLSLIENGKVKIPKPKEYELLIKNLGYQSAQYHDLEAQYSDFTYKLINALQFEYQGELDKLKRIFDSEFSIFDGFFYLNEVNEIIRSTIDAQTGLKLPRIEFLKKYLDSIECFSDDIQVMILDLSNLIVENYVPLREMRTQVNALVEECKVDLPMVSILKAGRNVRQFKFIKAQEELRNLSTDDLNDLMKFRIERLLYMIDVEHANQLTDSITSKNPSLKYPTVNRFERCRPFSSSAYIRYTLKDFKGALSDYENAILINPEAACFNLVYIADCLFETNQNDLLESKINLAKQHIRNYSQLNHDTLDFFEVLYGAESEKKQYYNFTSLFESLSKLNSDSPYVLIIRKHLLKYVKNNHRYKLIFDFETKLQNNN